MIYSDAGTPLAALKSLMAEFVAQRDWQQFHTPRNLAASVSVEAGELLELFQWLTPEEAATRSAADPAFRTAVAEEMSDVLLYLLSLANTLNLDLAAAVEKKMEKNRQKYPAAEYRGHYSRPLPQ